MPQVTHNPATVAEKICAAIANQIPDAELKAEPVGRGRLYQVWVVAQSFEDLDVSQRQNIIYAIVDQTLTRDEEFYLAGFMSLTPGEYLNPQGEGDPPYYVD